MIDTILKYYPKAIDCVDGHLGKKIATEYEELADDRYYKMIVYRCSHCQLPLGEEYAWKNDLQSKNRQSR